METDTTVKHKLYTEMYLIHLQELLRCVRIKKSIPTSCLNFTSTDHELESIVSYTVNIVT